MSYLIQIKLCDGQKLEAPIPDNEDPDYPYAYWATLADLLLTGQKVLPNAYPDVPHVVMVGLVFADAEDPMDQDAPLELVSSVYLLCPCTIEVTNRRVASRLVTEEGLASR